MEPKLLLLVGFILAGCHVTEAQLIVPSTLGTSITNATCGRSKLCVSSVSNCNPSGNSNCFFSSVQVNNQTANIELTGTTSGYVALVLTASNQSQGGSVVFICGTNNTVNSTVFFQTATLNGTTLTPANVSTVNSVQGALQQNPSLIQCTFTTTTNLIISNANNFTISNTTSAYIAILNGSTNGTQLGNAAAVFNSTAPINLTDSTVIASSSSASATSSTTNTTNNTVIVSNGTVNNTNSTMNTTNSTTNSTNNTVIVPNGTMNTTNSTMNTTNSTSNNTNSTSNNNNSTIIVPNGTSTNVSQLNITSNGCGSTKLCLSNPSACTPGAPKCFFTSSKLNNQTFSFELSGPSSGYVALALSNQNSSYVFVCGNNNTNNGSSFFFQTNTQNGSVLTPANVSTVYGILGAVSQNQSLIQCSFNTSTSFNLNTTANITPYNISILTGSTNGTQLGNATTLIYTVAPVNLSNPGAITSTNGSQLNIMSDGCGSTKLCLSNPSACTPGALNCFFTSSKLNNQTFSFELSGPSSGYVALALSNQNSSYVFVCGNNNTNNGSSFFFQTNTQNGSVLTPANVSTVYGILGAVTQNQSLIQCSFNTSSSFNLNTTANSTTYNISILTGSTNGTQLGTASTRAFTSTPVNLSNPSALPTASPSTSTTTANGTKSLVSQWTLVLALLLSAMSLHFVTSHSP